MSPLCQSGLGCRAAALALFLFCMAPASRAVTPAGAVPHVTPVAHARDASLDEYRGHLTALKGLVQACAAGRDLKTCDPLLVGPDDRVPVAAGATERRLVRYGWLRVLFSMAEEPDAPSHPAKKPGEPNDEPEGTRPAPLTTSQLLAAAETRLTADLAQTAAGHEPVHGAERAVMQQVLAGKDFRDIEQQSVRESMLEKVADWINRLFEHAAGLRARSAWVGRVLVWAFVVGVCVALIVGLLQLERRWRVRLVPEDRTPAPGAPSARDWQLWLADARAAAARGAWREAIHFVYWASISRLESRRLWPADRARTPREYLALIAAEDPRKPPLVSLTGSFERVWYGGRAAGEGDYRSAEALAAALIGGTAEGGAQ